MRRAHESAARARASGFWPLAIVFALFVLFLYGPMITIFVLSFQGPEGGLTFPMRGVSLHWFRKLCGRARAWSTSARRSAARSMLGVVVMLLTVLLSLRAGLAFRKKLRGGDALFYVTVASLIMPSIIVSLGIGLQFRLIDTGVNGRWPRSAPKARSRATPPRSACSPRRSART